MPENITVVGNVATAPEERSAGAGTPVASFRLAATARRFDKSTGTWVDGETNWFTVSAFRALGAHALASLHKGDRVIVTGRLSVRDWEAAGRRGTSVDIVADALGPDLLWGTTTFSRSASDRSESATTGADDAAPDRAPAAVDADGWALPQGADTPEGEPVPF